MELIETSNQIIQKKEGKKTMKKINMETANYYFMSNFKKSHSPIDFNIHFIPFIYALHENNIAYTIEANSDGMMIRKQ